MKRRDRIKLLNSLAHQIIEETDMVSVLVIGTSCTRGKFTSQGAHFGDLRSAESSASFMQEYLEHTLNKMQENADKEEDDEDETDEGDEWKNGKDSK